MQALDHGGLAAWISLVVVPRVTHPGVSGNLGRISRMSPSSPDAWGPGLDPVGGELEGEIPLPGLCLVMSASIQVTISDQMQSRFLIARSRGRPLPEKKRSDSLPAPTVPSLMGILELTWSRIVFLILSQSI